MEKKLLDLIYQIIDDIDRHNIKLYEFPESESDDDDEFKRLDNEIKV